MYWYWYWLWLILILKQLTARHHADCFHVHVGLTFMRRQWYRSHPPTSHRRISPRSWSAPNGRYYRSRTRIYWLCNNTRWPRVGQLRGGTHQQEPRSPSNAISIHHTHTCQIQQLGQWTYSQLLILTHPWLASPPRRFTWFLNFRSISARQNLY